MILKMLPVPVHASGICCWLGVVVVGRVVVLGLVVVVRLGVVVGLVVVVGLGRLPAMATETNRIDNFILGFRFTFDEKLNLVPS